MSPKSHDRSLRNKTLAVIAGTVVVVAGSTIGYRQVTGGGGGGTDANIWIDQNGGSCVRSASTIAYSGTGDSNSCSSLDAAYDASSCGDVVNIKAGNYGTGVNDPSSNPQNITGSKTCSGNPITIQETPGETVTIGYIGPSGQSCTTNGFDDITFKNFNLKYGIMMNGVNRITLDGIEGGSFGVICGVDILIQNSDWGPCEVSPTVPGTKDCRHYATSDGGDGKPHIWSVTNMTIKNNVFHEVTLIGQAHGECLQLNGFANPPLENIVIENLMIDSNWWWLCETNAISAGQELGGFQGFVTIQNNWFGKARTSSGNVAVNITGIPDDADWTLRFNSFAPGETLACEGTCSGYGGDGAYVAYGNIFGATPNCSGEFGVQSWSMDRNAFLGGNGCSTSNATILGSLPYVDDDNLGNANYHLTGTNVTGVDNAVPNSGGTVCPNLDKDGNSRPANTNCDAGADERNQ